MLDFICYYYLRSLKFRDSSFSSPPESFSQSCTRLSKAASLSPREAVFFSVFSPSQLQTNMMWCFTEWRLWKTTWLTVRHFTSLQKSTTQHHNSVVLFFTLGILNCFLFQYSGFKKVKHLFWKDTEVKLDRNPVFIPTRISWLFSRVSIWMPSYNPPRPQLLVSRVLCLSGCHVCLLCSVLQGSFLLLLPTNVSTWKIRQVCSPCSKLSTYIIIVCYKN